ncbi:hypothetical protein MHU86_894 [Fragilaria crotonensis]|nr:hypothetical protein MHU86_894 [Fragilaria crotonensis]
MTALWELPEVLLFHIVTYVAGPTERASVACHQLAPLCSASSLLLQREESPLWSAILKQDYGALLNERANKRSSKRLKQSHLQRVRDAHKMTRDNAEIAYYHLSELCMLNGTKNGLSRTKLASILQEFGAQPRINRWTSTGGTFLVECCRARHVRESTILKCVQELVERNGACVHMTTREAMPQTPLCVASARAMPSVVRYLLKHGADPWTRSSGRFRLYKKARRTVSCTNATPLEFAVTIRDAEKEEGATNADLVDLNKVIRLLEKEQQRHSAS